MTNTFEAKNVKPMLIGESRAAFDSPDYIYELKMDGERCLAYLDPRVGTDLRNKRNVAMLPKVPELTDIHKQVNARCILDGELILAVNGEPNFYEMQRRWLMSDKFKIQLRAEWNPVTFVAFDILYHADHAVTDLTVMERKALLEGVVTENERLAVSRYIEENGVALFDMAALRSLEGIVAKRKDSRYYPDKRTRDWIKCKNLQDEDFVVRGYAVIDHAVSILLGKYQGERLVFRGENVTMGVSPQDIRILQTHRRADAPIMDDGPGGNERVVWLVPDMVCTVRYMERTPAGAMRQPVFKGFRTDKDALECQEHDISPKGDA